MKAGRAAPSGAPRCGERACVPLRGRGVHTGEGSRALYHRLAFSLGPFVFLDGTVCEKELPASQDRVGGSASGEG